MDTSVNRSTFHQAQCYNTISALRQQFSVELGLSMDLRCESEVKNRMGMLSHALQCACRYKLCDELVLDRFREQCRQTSPFAWSLNSNLSTPYGRT